MSIKDVLANPHRFRRAVTGKCRSPLNKKVWSLGLECGHDLFVSGKRAPKFVYCHKCVALPAAHAKGGDAK